MDKLVVKAIYAADKAEKEGLLTGRTKREFAGEWLYHTDYAQRLMNSRNYHLIRDMSSQLDNFYQECR